MFKFLIFLSFVCSCPYLFIFIFLSRYEYSTTTSNTQQSIKKNINDLDHLLNNLSSSHNSSREVSPSRRLGPHLPASHLAGGPSSHLGGGPPSHLGGGQLSHLGGGPSSHLGGGPPSHLGGGPVGERVMVGSSTHLSRTEERRERLISNASQYRFDPPNGLS